MSFEKLGISKDFVKGLKELKIINPSEIQEIVIPLLMQGDTDLVGQAQTGTGKTAAYGLPLLHQIDAQNKVTQALILCPTRELGKQVAKQLFKFTKYTDKIFTEAVYGGEPIERQIASLARTTHIVVATPGRLIDLVKRKAVDLRQVKTIILDEADEMLSMGFKKELDQILEFTSSAKNKWLFSATIPTGIKQIIDTHLSPDAPRIDVGGREVVNKKIEHQYIMCDEHDKLHKLVSVLKNAHGRRGLIFCRTKADCDKLSKQLIAKNVSADAIHGDLLQKERDKVMRAFKNEKLQILVATDIAARGLDVEDLAFVIHNSLPEKEEYYIHRSGRTARAGKDGISLALVTSADMRHLKFLSKKLGIVFSQTSLGK